MLAFNFFFCATLCLTRSGSIELEDNTGGLAGCCLVVETNTGGKDTRRLGVLERISRRLNIEKVIRDGGC